MNLCKTTKKTLRVSRGFTYNYYTSPARGPKPTLLLLHGYPDAAWVWSGLLDHLLPQGYGIIALDCLGNGETSKPTSLGAYAWQYMTADVIEIIDSENLTSVISVGHDWGSVFCQRLYNFYPSRVSGVIMVIAPYMPPTGQFDLDKINETTKEAFGYGIYEYWHFFTADDGVELMNRNLESVYTAAYGDPYSWLENWTAPGGMRKWVSEGHTQPTLEFATAEHKAEFMERFGKDGGFDAPNRWYKSLRFGKQDAAERLLPDGSDVVKVPTLYWGGKQDFVCRPDLLQPSIKAGLLPHIKSIIREGGHWAHLEDPELFGQDLLGWLQENF